MTITAAADGSALGNPGPAGWAWYVDENTWHAGGWPHGTNNQGELMAVLDLFRSTRHVSDQDLVILCDSQYVINCLTKWLPGWKRKGWKKADGKPVLNVELLKDLDEALKGRTYRFEWVKGHAGHPLNEAADDRARAVATAYQQKKSIPEGPGFPGSDTTAADTTQTDTTTAHTGVRQDGTAETSTDQWNADERNADQRNAVEPAADDLFAFLDLEDEAEPGPPLDSAAVVISQEKRLLEPEVRTDVGELEALLHPDFEEIGASGRLWSRDDMIAALVTGTHDPTSFELISVSEVAPGAILLQYRTDGASGLRLRSSLWLQQGTQWRLRFNQSTPE